jgi:hypothetical protein
MNKSIFLLLAIATVGCTPVKPAFSSENTTMAEELEVKGRQGLLINQKLSFGPYQTSKVKRSWTKTDKASMPLPTSLLFWILYDKGMSKAYVDKNQKMHFTMATPEGQSSDVYATSVFSREDILIGDNPNSAVNIFSQVFGSGSKSEDVFYAQVYIGKDENPWQLMLDNDASQTKAKSYEGVFALNDQKYYRLKPITKVQGKTQAQDLWFGSIGYEIVTPENKSVAAVSLMDRGKVYFNTTDAEEHFLLANLAAALLLQENLEASPE